MAAGNADLLAGNDAWASSVQQIINSLNEGYVLDQSLSNTTGALTTNATFSSAVAFTLVGDRTSTYTVGRRLRIVHGGGTSYTEVGSSSFSSPNTTVTIGAVSSGPTTLTTPITSVAFAMTFPSMTVGSYTHALPWQVLSRSNTTVVGSTASVTSDSTLFTYTVPAALLGSSGMLRLTCFGDLLNNSGVALPAAWKFVVGTSTVIANSTTTSSIATSTARRGWISTVILQNAASASAQNVYGWHNVGSPHPVTFQLMAEANNSYFSQGRGTATELSTAAMTISWIVRVGSTASTVDLNGYGAILEFAP